MYRTIDMTDEAKIKILERHVDELAEIYDAVQIVATGLRQDGGTFCHKRGSGNWYARESLCREFVQQAKSEEAAEQIAKKLYPPDDE